MKLKRDALDAAFSDYIRWRDQWICRRCKRPYEPPTSSYQSAHIYTRANPSIRVDTDNAIGLCAGCHMWGHQRPEEFKEWCVRELGKDHMERLKIKYYARGSKPTKSEKELLRQFFIKKTQEIKDRVKASTGLCLNQTTRKT